MLVIVLALASYCPVSNLVAATNCHTPLLPPPFCLCWKSYLYRSIYTHVHVHIGSSTGYMVNVMEVCEWELRICIGNGILVNILHSAVCGAGLALFPGPAHSSLAVRNSQGLGTRLVQGWWEATRV